MTPQSKVKWDDLTFDEPPGVADHIAGEATRLGMRTSSYTRTPAHNKAVGGAEHSNHLTGNALDLVGTPEQKKATRKHIESLYGDQISEMLDEGDHLHVAWKPTAKPRQTAKWDDLSFDDDSTAVTPGASSNKPVKSVAPQFQEDTEAERQFEIYKKGGNADAVKLYADRLKAKGYEVGADEFGNPYQKRPSTAPAAQAPADPVLNPRRRVRGPKRSKLAQDFRSDPLKFWEEEQTNQPAMQAAARAKETGQYPEGSYSAVKGGVTSDKLPKPGTTPGLYDAAGNPVADVDVMGNPTIRNPLAQRLANSTEGPLVDLGAEELGTIGRALSTDTPEQKLLKQQIAALEGKAAELGAAKVPRSAWSESERNALENELPDLQARLKALNQQQDAETPGNIFSQVAGRARKEAANLRAHGLEPGLGKEIYEGAVGMAPVLLASAVLPEAAPYLMGGQAAASSYSSGDPAGEAITKGLIGAGAPAVMGAAGGALERTTLGGLSKLAGRALANSAISMGTEALEGGSVIPKTPEERTAFFGRRIFDIAFALHGGGKITEEQAVAKARERVAREMAHENAGRIVEHDDFGLGIADANQRGVKAQHVRVKFDNGSIKEVLLAGKNPKARFIEPEARAAAPGDTQQGTAPLTESAQPSAIPPESVPTSATQRPDEVQFEKRAADGVPATETTPIPRAQGATPAERGLVTESQPPVTSERPVAEGDRRQGDRRQNAEERKRVEAMTPEERAQALLTHELTGIPNRRAYNESNAVDAEAGIKNHHAALDVVGLKRTNDKIAPEMGDEILHAVAQAVADEHPGGAYHLKGDEFALKASSPEELQAKIGNIQARLRDATVRYEAPDGTVHEIKGVELHHGIGENEAAANAGLNRNKATAGQDATGRTLSGLAPEPAAGREAHGNAAAEVGSQEAGRSGASTTREQAQDVEPGTVHKFSSTQVDLPNEHAKAVRALGRTIPTGDLAADGRETEPHITVKYGLHTADAAKVREILADEGPITATIGKTSTFKSVEDGTADAVIAEVDSPDLHRLNKIIADALPHTDTHPEYKPHVTVAYVKPGLGEKYSGRTDLEGRKVELNEITFSGKNGEMVTIPLGGKSENAETHHSAFQPRDESGHFDGPPEYPQGSKERALPQTLAAAGLEPGTNKTYEPQPLSVAEERGRAILKEKGVDGAMEFARGDNVSAESTIAGFAAIRELQDRAAEIAGDTKRAGEAEVLMQKAVDFASEFAEKMTRTGQAINAVKAVAMFSPERQLTIATKLKKELRAKRKWQWGPKELTVEEATRITANAEKGFDADARIKHLEGLVAELETERRARDPFLEASAAIPKRKPVSLLTAIRKAGGIHESESDIAMHFSNKEGATTGLITKNGRSVEDMVDHLREEGFILPGYGPWGENTRLNAYDRDAPNPWDSLSEAMRLEAAGKGPGRYEDIENAERPQPPPKEKTNYEGRLKRQSNVAFEKLRAKMGKLDFGNLKGEVERPRQIGAVGERGKLPGDAEIIAEYGAASLGKVDLPTWEADILRAVPEAEPYLKDIRRRAYEIYSEEKRADTIDRLADMKTRSTAAQEIASEIREARRALREAEKVDTRQARRERRDQAKAAREAADAAVEADRQERAKIAREARAQLRETRKALAEAEKASQQGAGEEARQRLFKEQEAVQEIRQKIREAERAQTRQEKKAIRQKAQEAAKAAGEAKQAEARSQAEEARQRLQEARKTAREANKAQQKGYRESVGAQREAERTSRLWDTPIRDSAAAAKERLATAAPDSPQTLEDLVHVATGMLLPEKPGGPPRSRVLPTSKFYHDLKQQFPDLVNKKNKGQIFKQAFQRMEDAKSAAREAAKIASLTKGEAGAMTDSQVMGLRIQKAQAERESFEARAAQAREFQRLSRSTAGRVLHEMQSAPRALKASIDAPLGRQGLFYLVTHPIKTLREGRTIEGYRLSREGFAKAQQELQQHPDFELGRQAGLDTVGLSTEVDPRYASEEAFQSEIAARLWHVRKSEQAYNLAMNQQRISMFSKYADAGRLKGYTFESHPEFFKQAAHLVNSATGRGNLGKNLKTYANAANHLLFSGRLQVSRVQLINDVYNPLRYIHYDPVMRRIAATEALRSMAAFAAIFGGAAAMGAKVTSDPDDADFGKAVFGKTHVDLTGGMGGFVRQMFRMGRAIESTIVGAPQADNDKFFEVLKQFGRSKLAPVPGAVVNLIAGTDMRGKQVTLGMPQQKGASAFLDQNQLIQMVVPMIANDLIDAATEDGWVGVAKAAPAFAGFGLGTYKGTPEVQQFYRELDLTGQKAKSPEGQTQGDAKAHGVLNKAATVLSELKKQRDAATDVPTKDRIIDAMNRTATKAMAEAKAVPEKLGPKGAEPQEKRKPSRTIGRAVREALMQQ